MRNYIVDQNKFKLSGPPKWWLDKLWEFDNSLVIVPSRQGFYYRLAQKRKLNLPENVVNEALWQYSDTQMLAQYGLIPVTTIIATATWSDWMFHELAKRAPHRMGGAKRVIKELEDGEAALEAKRRAETDQHLGDVSKDGWKYYQRLTGQRTFVDSTKTKGTTIPLGPRRKGSPTSSPTPARSPKARQSSDRPQSGSGLILVP